MHARQRAGPLGADNALSSLCVLVHVCTSVVSVMLIYTDPRRANLPYKKAAYAPDVVQAIAVL